MTRAVSSPLGYTVVLQDIPPMREGGKRLVLARPGPMQRQGVKSLTWVTGLLDAIDEAGGEQLGSGG